ncbi:MAG: flagellar basal body P-ring formation protein FlgA [Proteobacteria bacterium]|nr:flagellar basal body P-ring formation protein FlgA [Pseudomonadota bacterium]
MGPSASKIRQAGLLALLAGMSCLAGEIEPLQHIESAARDFAGRELGAPGQGQRLEVGPLDGRLRLPKCEGALGAVRGPGTVLRDRALVEVICRSPQWHVFVPARLQGSATVVALKRPRMAGDRLEPGDLVLVQADPSSLPMGYFTEPAEITGTILKRALGSGVILTNQLLQSAQGIVRGQAVTLLAETGGVEVRMKGQAMSEGSINQRIKVRNESSGKILEGVARSSQLVLVNP